MKESNYSSVICEYCRATDYGCQPCSCQTPNGYSSCEGRYCEEAYETYIDETNDDTPIEELF